MDKLTYEVVWMAIKVLLNATRHRIMFGNAFSDVTHKLNLKYLYMFPIDNDVDDRKQYRLGTKELYEYFIKKDYIFTACNFNQPPDDSFSYNSNSIILVLPEYIDFDSLSVRSKLKLSADLSYLKVYYFDDNLKNIVDNCISSFTKKQKDELLQSQVTKALLNEFEY